MFLANNYMFHAGTKHVDEHYQHVWEKVLHTEINMDWVKIK